MVPDMGEKSFGEKNRIPEILDFFSSNYFSTMSGTLKNYKFSLYPFLTFLAPGFWKFI
jgi:hypothetical protein